MILRVREAGSSGAAQEMQTLLNELSKSIESPSGFARIISQPDPGETQSALTVFEGWEVVKHFHGVLL